MEEKTCNQMSFSLSWPLCLFILLSFSATVTISVAVFSFMLSLSAFMVSFHLQYNMLDFMRTLAEIVLSSSSYGANTILKKKNLSFDNLDAPQPPA